MPSFIKPKIRLPHQKTNDIGLIRSDYDGVMSTLCAGCGHDSVTAAMATAFFELAIEPHNAVKVSGIGCSSKTTTYFMKEAHGNNTVHGRMPSVATGAMAGNPHMTYIGVSGDGDSLSIGVGQMVHAMRRNVNMLYMLENNGVYGLTKGQFSAAADAGSVSKKGEVNIMKPIDPCALALSVGATFVARSFSGDKAQLGSLIKAGIKHKGSTKSYAHAFKYYHKAVHADYVPPSDEIRASYEDGECMPIELHDGGVINLRKLDNGYDPTDRGSAFSKVLQTQDTDEILTGLLYIDETTPDMATRNKLPARPLNTFPYAELNPGSDALKAAMREFS